MSMRLFVAGFFAAVVLPCLGEASDATAPAGNAAHLNRLAAEVDKPYIHLLSQNGIDLAPGETYRLTFWARASEGRMLRISTKFDQPPWKGLQDQRVQLDTNWTFYEVSLNGDGAEPGHTRLEFRYAGPEAGEIWIADVRLLPETADAAAPNMIQNGRFEDKLLNWYIEGQRPGIFAVDVEALPGGGANP